MNIILLKGGLGNQLFQLCLYLRISKINKYTYIDNKLGFLLDFKYKRKFELIKLIDYIKLVDKKLSFITLLIYIANKLIPKILYFLPFKIIKDKDDYIFNLNESYLKVNKKNNFFNSNLYDGYFQNYKIVNEVLPELMNLVKPYLDSGKDGEFSSLYKLISSKENSVALGIRFYEESSNPKAHALNGSQKKVSDFNKIIKKFETDLDSPHFFIFVQEENDFTNQLKFSSEYNFITHKKGYNGSWERLKAQSLCKHHIFNNSSFYWWGCLFSKNRFLQNKNNKPQKIYVSDNFIFQEIYNPDWIKF